MIIVICQIVAGIIGLLSLWYQEYQSAESKAERQKEADNEKRIDLVTGNVGAVEQRIDAILCKTNSSNAGEPVSDVEEGTASTVRRLAAFGISIEQDSGSSRTL